MRLIDADEYKGKCICNHLYSGVTKLIEVDAVPTAFDLESVIAELEEKILKVKEILMSCIDEDYAVRLRVKMSVYEELKEILNSTTNATNGTERIRED